MAAKKKTRAHRLTVTNFRLDKPILKMITTMAKEESKARGTTVTNTDVVRLAIHERYHKKKRDT